MIVNICNIESKLNQPWAMLYTYWLGITLKPVFPILGKNQYVHTLDIPSGVGIVKDIILKYKTDKTHYANISVQYIENNTLCFHDMKNLSRRLG